MKSSLLVFSLLFFVVGSYEAKSFPSNISTVTLPGKKRCRKMGEKFGYSVCLHNIKFDPETGGIKVDLDSPSKKVNLRFHRVDVCEGSRSSLKRFISRTFTESVLNGSKKCDA